MGNNKLDSVTNFLILRVAVEFLILSHRLFVEFKEIFLTHLHIWFRNFLHDVSFLLRCSNG